jgi:hypothetical protein
MPIAVTDKTFEVLATPNPEELSFRVRVSGSQMRADTLVGKKGDAYSTFDFSILKIASDGWASYLYTEAQEAGNGDLWLYFAKNKTEAEKNTPFRVSSKFEDKEWDTVLLDLAIVKESGMPRSVLASMQNRKAVLSGPRHGVRPVLIPGGARGTRFIIREFQGPSEYKIPAHETPVPMMVSYSIDEHEGNIVCLHDDITVKARRTVESAAGTGVPHGVVAGLFFPATNMTEWEDHFVSDTQEFVNGVWHRVQVEAIAPDMEDPISTN